MTCDHDINAREVAVVADGYCPLCMADEIERLRDALHKIDSWSRAYPLKIFPEPDLKRAAELLKAGGITLDAIGAHAMRHIVEGVGKIARGALHIQKGGK